MRGLAVHRLRAGPQTHRDVVLGMSDGGEPTPDPTGMKAAEAFHVHLGVCRQCDGNLTILCPLGAELMMALLLEDDVVDDE